MKAGQSLRCLFWASLYCVLYLVNASDEDLMDFDFTDLTEVGWDYETKDSNKTTHTKALNDIHEIGSMTVDDSDLTENNLHPFDFGEKFFSKAVSKALMNKDLHQKFVEVMPILRVLTRQQRLALSALISAQIKAKKGQEPKIEQVRMMFGDDKKLLVPIIYDIARLLSNSAQKYLHSNNDVEAGIERHQKRKPKITQRKLDLMTSEEMNDDIVGVMPSAAMPQSTSFEDISLEDFFSETPDDVLDPKSINEALQGSVGKAEAKTNTAYQRDYNRGKRHAELQSDVSIRALKLNTTSFVSPSENKILLLPLSSKITNGSAITPATQSTAIQSYKEIEDLAFASLNGTEIEMTDAMDTEKKKNEPLPVPEELIAGPRYRINSNKRRIIRPFPAMRKREQVQQPRSPLHPKVVLPSMLGFQAVPAPKKCERFTASMCIRTDDYPLEQIMGSIRRHKNAMTALLAEYHDNPSSQDFSDEFEDFSYTKRRREGESIPSAGGTMCQSIVRYARPQKAKSASGEWKYIVNTGQHTQTLRLEKCSSPQESCSYLAQNYRSHCAQVYNYHRLLSWDKTRGLHVDIFKVPTCCSCQIDGYRQQFPPFDTVKSKEYRPTFSSEHYATINEEFDYNAEENEDDFNFQYANHRNNEGNRDNFDIQATNELKLESQNVRPKVYAPNPTVGSYLIPPGTFKYDSANQVRLNNHHKYRTAVAASSTTTPKSPYKKSAHRRPYKSLNHGFDGESRADLETSPSEPHTDKEINLYGSTFPSDQMRHDQQKRKRVYSIPHTLATGSSRVNSPVTTTASLSTSSFSSFEHGNGYGYSNDNRFDISNGHGRYGQSIPVGSSMDVAPNPSTWATSPTFYTPNTEKNIVRAGFADNVKPKTRLHAGSTHFPIKHTQISSTSSYSALPPATEYVTNHNISSGPKGATNPSSFYINSIPNNSVPIGSSKRINYSYHPIIDFFKNGNKLPATIASATTTYSTPMSQEQLIPFKIPKYSSVIQEKAMFTGVSTAVDVNGLPTYRERRTETGMSDKLLGGQSSSVGDNAFYDLSLRSRSAPISRKVGNVLDASINTESNVWHPMLISKTIFETTHV